MSDQLKTPEREPTAGLAVDACSDVCEKLPGEGDVETITRPLFLDMKIKINPKKLETAVRELARDVDGRITVSSRLRLGTVNGFPLILTLTNEDDDPPQTTARFEAIEVK